MTERMTPAQYRKSTRQAPAQQPETAILKGVRDYLRIQGWHVLRIQQGLGCEKGISDLICIRGGRVVFLEVKTPKGRLSAHQEAFRDTITAHGGEYVVARSVEDVMEL